MNCRCTVGRDVCGSNMEHSRTGVDIWERIEGRCISKGREKELVMERDRVICWLTSDDMNYASRCRARFLNTQTCPYQHSTVCLQIMYLLNVPHGIPLIEETVKFSINTRRPSVIYAVPPISALLLENNDIRVTEIYRLSHCVVSPSSKCSFVRKYSPCLRFMSFVSLLMTECILSHLAHCANELDAEHDSWYSRQ